METTRSHPRTLEQAFGPYAGRYIHPMGSDKFKMPRRKMSPTARSYLVMLVLVAVAALCVWVKA